MTSPGTSPTVLITDLDNTLWDWFEAWYASFSVLLAEVSEMSGVPVLDLEPEIKKIHQEQGTAEYSFLLNEVPSLVDAAGGVEPSVAFDAALHTFYSTRKRATSLYPGVRETLDVLRRKGVLIIAYTESVAYWTEWRIRHTGLDGVIDALYSSPDHDLPPGMALSDLRTQPDDEYGLKYTNHHHVRKGALKPNADILKSILNDFDRVPDEAVYVGDSLMKDIAMAQSVGVLDVHAAYGVVHDGPEYDLLRRVSHWTDADVEREREINSRGDVTPSITLEREFGEILTLFDQSGGAGE